MSDESARRRAVVYSGQTDYVRWFDESQYLDAWSKRSEEAVKLIGRARWICDIGCGKQGLRSLLPIGSVYLPCDLKRWTPDTCFCDLNAGILPVSYLRLCDICLVLGVVEYLYDAGSFLHSVKRYAPTAIISYNPTDTCSAHRPAMGWVNAFSSSELADLIQSAGLGIDHWQELPQGQVLIRIINKRMGMTMLRKQFWRFRFRIHR